MLGEWAKYLVHTDYPQHWPSLLPSLADDHCTQVEAELRLRLKAKRLPFTHVGWDGQAEHLMHLLMHLLQLWPTQHQNWQSDKRLLVLEFQLYTHSKT